MAKPAQSTSSRDKAMDEPVKIPEIVSTNTTATPSPLAVLSFVEQAR